MNTGYLNTGNWNTGNKNTGDSNTGKWNTGDLNTGNLNTGNWNTCYKETGFFNTKETKSVRVFNKHCDLESWENAIKPEFIYFELVRFISESSMTEYEKEENQTFKTTGGYLKSYEYKEAFKKSYEDLTEEERVKQTKQLKALPNFDKDIFYEISGIDIDKYDKKKITIDGKDIYISEESYKEFKKQFVN